MKIEHGTNYYSAADKGISSFWNGVTQAVKDLSFFKYACAWYSCLNPGSKFKPITDAGYRRISLIQFSQSLPKTLRGVSKFTDEASKSVKKRNIEQIAKIAETGMEAGVQASILAWQLKCLGYVSLVIKGKDFTTINYNAGNCFEVGRSSLSLVRELRNMSGKSHEPSAWLNLVLSVNALAIALLYAFSFSAKQIPLLPLKTIAFTFSTADRLSQSKNRTQYIPYIPKSLPLSL